MGFGRQPPLPNHDRAALIVAAVLAIGILALAMSLAVH